MSNKTNTYWLLLTTAPFENSKSPTNSEDTSRGNFYSVGDACLFSVRSRRTIPLLLASYVGDQHRQWDRWLLEFRFAMNTIVQESTGYNASRSGSWMEAKRTSREPYTNRLILVALLIQFLIGSKISSTLSRKMWNEHKLSKSTTMSNDASRPNFRWEI